MKPFVSALMYRNQHHGGGMLGIRGLPVVDHGICTFDIGGSAFSFAHPARSPEWQQPGGHLHTWTELKRQGWVPGYLRDNMLEEWFEETDLPDQAQGVWLLGDLEQLPVLREWTTAPTERRPTDTGYEATVRRALPFIYTGVQQLAAQFWPEAVTLVGHTNHVRHAPYAGSGAYLEPEQVNNVRLLSSLMEPVGFFVPVKAFWKRPDIHGGWSVKECAEHVCRSLGAAQLASHGAPVVLNIGVHGKEDLCIRPEELAGSLLAAERSPGVAGCRLWGSVTRLEEVHGQSWRAGVEAVVRIGREMAAEMAEEVGQ